MLDEKVNDKVMTVFSDEWQSLKIYESRNIEESVVVMEKYDDHLIVYLKLPYKVSVQFRYGLDRNDILLYSGTPKDSDGTNEDLNRKINDVSNEAEKIYYGINYNSLDALLYAFNAYENAENRIYEVLEIMKGKNKESDKK